MAENEKPDKPWVVRDVPVHTRRKVKVYAVEHDMTMGQAVEALVDTALAKEGKPVEAPPVPKSQSSVVLPPDPDSEVLVFETRDNTGQQHSFVTVPTPPHKAREWYRSWYAQHPAGQPLSISETFRVVQRLNELAQKEAEKKEEIAEAENIRRMGDRMRSQKPSANADLPRAAAEETRHDR